MTARISTVAFQGVEVLDIDVQVQVTNGLPAFNIVGLPDKTVAESRERIRGALHAIGLPMPPQRITVNLAPARVQKEGGHYDLPIALALLSAMSLIDEEDSSSKYAMGELSLDGTINSVPGVLPAAMQAFNQKKQLICPASCGNEAAWVEGLEIIAAPHLLSLLIHLKGTQVLSQPEPKAIQSENHATDFSDVKGQTTAKRVMEIAAAGGHNVMMIGPPGAGKSMLAARLPTILPDMNAQESLDISMIYSVAGKLKAGGLLKERPFREPHHSASLPSLVGGGIYAKPGEISLAHHGVLFLDELPEFSRATLESLRQPIETGKSVVSRANGHYTYPANFQLIAAMNPCRCGYMGDPDRACSRAPRCGQEYQSKISGPLLDRFDLFIELAALSPTEISKKKGGESSFSIQQRVIAARQKQMLRNPNKIKNADLSAKDLDVVLSIHAEAQAIMNRAVDKLKLSARAYHRLLKVGQTIADLDQQTIIQKHHISEALSYRLLRYV
jgi:magnesium chelatase family protein